VDFLLHATRQAFSPHASNVPDYAIRNDRDRLPAHESGFAGAIGRPINR
jgi:hypothetical protein